jgi:hypothetical protein
MLEMKSILPIIPKDVFYVILSFCQPCELVRYREVNSVFLSLCNRLLLPLFSDYLFLTIVMFDGYELQEECRPLRLVGIEYSNAATFKMDNDVSFTSYSEGSRAPEAYVEEEDGENVGWIMPLRNGEHNSVDVINYTMKTTELDNKEDDDEEDNDDMKKYYDRDINISNVIVDVEIKHIFKAITRKCKCMEEDADRLANERGIILDKHLKNVRILLHLSLTFTEMAQE